MVASGGGYFLYNPVMWFLPCLFVTEILGYWLLKIKVVWFRLVLVLVVAFCGMQFKQNLPWGINIALVAIQFYCVGNLFRPLLQTIKFSWLRLCAIFIVSLGLYTIIMLTTGDAIDMATPKYESVFAVVEIMAYLGILFICAFSEVLSSTRLSKLISFYGRNTILIFCLHPAVIRILKAVLIKLTIENQIEGSVILSIVTDVVVVLLLTPVIFLYNKYVQPLLKNCYLQ